MEMLGSFNLARLIFLRALAVLYFVAFLVALKQFPALLGEHGLMPVPQFIQQIPFRSAPSLFYFGYSDRLLQIVSLTGMLVSCGLMLGLLDRGPWWCTTGLWLILWVLYLSIVNVGQDFYSFGWESMLLEAGFFAAFLGPRLAPSIIPILILRWMLFRVELGAGLIKLRGDACWRDFTCLYYHHETQPMPNPLSWHFHHLPKGVHRFGVGFSHFVQLIAPFGLFAPASIAAISAGLIIFHQLMLIMSGNYSWLNWLTVILALTAFSDSLLGRFLFWKIPQPLPRPAFFNGILYVLAVVTIFLSVQPALNLLSERQLMNFNFNPFHLVSCYGAFGAVTKQRYEIVMEGTDNSAVTPDTIWREYEFKGKPGDVARTPPQFAPYHLRLDWLMWFLPFSMRVVDHQISNEGYPLWFIRFSKKLLEGDAQTLGLLRSNPFPYPPKFLRAEVYLYHFTSAEERRKTGAIWTREQIGDYLSPTNLERFSNIQ